MAAALMTQLRQYLHRRLTPLESVAVVVVVAILGGVAYALYLYVTAKLLEARLDAATPKACAAIREERSRLQKAIEAYKAHFGFYPPDHIINRQPLVVDPVTNTLCYELAGVLFNPTNKMLQVPGLESAEADYVKQYLACEGFRNCSESLDQLSRFLTNPVPAFQLHDDPDVFVLGYSLYEAIEPELAGEFQVSPWRYVSSTPTNNPGRFDLWIELGTKHRKIVIGNWKAVE